LLLLAQPTALAQTLNLDIVAVSRETRSFRLLSEQAADSGVIEFDNLVARAADEKLSHVNRFRRFAGDKGIDGIDAVDETGIEQKLQGAINSGRGLCAFSLFQRAQYFIRPDGSVALRHQFEYAPANRGELKAALRTHFLGGSHHYLAAICSFGCDERRCVSHVYRPVGRLPVNTAN
jgi:hypothetical protein